MLALCFLLETKTNVLLAIQASPNSTLELINGGVQYSILCGRTRSLAIVHQATEHLLPTVHLLSGVSSHFIIGCCTFFQVYNFIRLHFGMFYLLSCIYRIALWAVVPSISCIITLHYVYLLSGVSSHCIMGCRTFFQVYHYITLQDVVPSFQVYHYFSLLSLHHALITDAGRLVGIISLSEVSLQPCWVTSI